MTHLRIEQSGITEEVSSSVISKLYEIAHAGLDVSSNLLGRLHVAKAYGNQIDWLTTTYPNLYINVDSRYIAFADSLVLSKLTTAWGDGTGVTLLDTLSVSSIPGGFFASMAITSFNELNDFTTITSVDWGGFVNCSSLTSVGLNNIRAVGFQSFYQSGLTGILNLPAILTIGGTVRNLGSSFESCTGITEVHCGSNLTRVGRGAFKGCTNLTTFSTTSTNFDIYDEAFSGCTALTTIDLSNITKIGPSAFLGCSALTNIDVSNVTEIDDYCFNGTGISSLSLPNLISLNGWSTFLNCLGLQKVSNLGSIPYLGGNSFSNCTNLTEVTLPSTCIGFSEGVFRNCSNLEKVNLEYVQYFDLSNAGVFNNCLKLRVLNYQNLLCPSGITQNNVTTDHSYRSRANGNWFIAPGATDIYLPKFDTLIGGRDDTKRTFNGWFCGNGWYRKSTGNTNTPAWNTIYLRDVTTVGKGAFCGCDIINLIINSNTVPNVVDLQWGATTYNGKLFEGNHTIQHIYVKPELVNDFKNDTYWGEKASIIESIANCPRKTANEVLAGEVGLVDAWM